MPRADDVTDGLPPLAFVAPNGSNRSHVGRFLHQAVDLLVELASSAAERPVVSGSNEAGRRWDALEDGPMSAEEILDEIRDVYLASANLSHPGSIAHMDPPPTTASLLGDLFVSALNDNLLFRELAPVLTELERNLLRNLARRFGLGAQGGGLMLPGGSLANLQALVIARNAAQVRQRDRARQPLLVASDAAHISVRKAAKVIGLDEDLIRWLPTGPDGRFELSRLARELSAGSQSARPIVLVLTAGTTVTGIIDPLHEASRLARDHSAWLHVDAAFGGALCFSRRHRTALDGIQEADSITFNPQKGLCVARTSAMLLLRRERDLVDHFRVAAPYSASRDVERGEISLQGTSRGDVLKLWLTLRHLGLAGCESLVDRGLALARGVADELGRLPCIEIAAEPQTPVLCFRARSPEGSQRSDDEWNLRLRTHLRERFQLSVSAPSWKNRRWLRLVTINPFCSADLGRKLARGVESFHSPRRAGQRAPATAGRISADPRAEGRKE